MSLPRLAYILATRRILSSWRLELVLFSGILLAVALLASGVVFSDLVADASLRHTLREATPEEANLRVRSFAGSDAPPTARGRKADYRSRVDFVQSRVGGRMDQYLHDQATVLETATFFFTGHPQLELDNEVRPRGEVKYYSGLNPQRMTLEYSDNLDGHLWRIGK